MNVDDYDTTNERDDHIVSSLVDAERILDSTPSRDVNTSLSLDYVIIVELSV